MSDEQPSELLAARRRKLEALRENGIEPFPHAYPGVRSIAEAKAPHEALEAGDETDDHVRVAGRLHARRGQGKAAFLDLDDRTGRMQLHARVDVLGEESLRALLDLDLGDLLGAEGTIFRTRRGELSLKLDNWELLAKSLRPPPEKHHGLTDVETRFRHRELDLIANEQARELFTTRAKVITSVRRQLDDWGFIEVETPGAAADLRRRRGAPVHDLLQRARARLLPAGRDRALPQAADRRRARARVRDRQGLPQRGHLVQAQPRVHDARVVRGVRGLRRHRRAQRGRWSSRVASRRRATRASSTSRRPGTARRCRTRSAPAPASTSSPTASSSRCARRSARPAMRCRRRRRGRRWSTSC